MWGIEFDGCGVGFVSLVLNKLLEVEPGDWVVDKSGSVAVVVFLGVTNFLVSKRKRR